MPPRSRIITNDAGDTKVAAMLGRIEADMGWVKTALEDGKDATERQDAVIKNLEKVAERLTSAIEKLTEEQKAVSKLEERIRAIESLQASWKPAMTRWQKIHDAFVMSMIKVLVTGALIAAASAYAVNKVLK